MVGKLQKNGMLMLKFNISAQGYVLLAVLVFLQIFSLLGLFALTQANLVLKTNASHWLATGYRQTTISVLAEVEARVMRDPSACVMPLTAAADVAVKSESWWQQNACMISAQGAIYRYVVESLGQDLCGVFESNDNRLMHAENYRITLFALPQNIKGAKILLQSTVARAVNTERPCTEATHLIVQGRQMLRDI